MFQHKTSTGEVKHACNSRVAWTDGFEQEQHTRSMGSKEAMHMLRKKGKDLLMLPYLHLYGKPTIRPFFPLKSYYPRSIKENL
jgi:hypothetical protein